VRTGTSCDQVPVGHLWSYPTSVTEALGLVGIAAFITAMIGLSAGATWLVVRLSPSPAKKKN
jgi:hypothetical protein